LFLADWWLERAVNAARAEKWTHAVIAGRHSVAYNPYRLMAYYQLGHAYNMMGRTSESLAAYSHLKGLAPLYNRLNHNMAVVLARAKEYDRAVAVLQEVMPTNSAEEERLLLAEIHLAAGNATEARAILLASLERESDSVPAMKMLARVAMNLGRPEEAVSWNLKVVALEPKDAQARLQLAMAYTKAGMGTRGLAMTELYRVMALDPAGPLGARAQEELRKLGGGPGGPAASRPRAPVPRPPRPGPAVPPKRPAVPVPKRPAPPRR
jgi:tetratricopeptide (TPR) repeat protein